MRQGRPEEACEAYERAIAISSSSSSSGAPAVVVAATRLLQARARAGGGVAGLAWALPRPGILAVALILALVLHQVWVWIPAGILTVILVWTLAILPRQARAYGYQLRDDDLVFRRGILWQRMVAVPYGRMQLVDITHGPLDRGFGIAQLKLVTAAAATGVTNPGLSQQAAESLRDTLIAVAETRRTGL